MTRAILLGSYLMPGKFRPSWDSRGIHAMPFHYYSPAFRTSDTELDWDAPVESPGLDFRDEEQLALLRALASHGDEVQWPEHAEGPLEYYLTNSNFGPADAAVLYSMLRRCRPRLLIEVGAGFSTLIARQAIRANEAEGHPCRHVCIEPFEMPWLEQLEVEVIREKVERVPADLFLQLSDNDVLFIDSSHVIRPGGDVTYLYLGVLPQLSPGVVIHAHDIFLPFPYPKEWVEEGRFWSEQYLLQALLIGSPLFEVLLAVHYLHRNFGEDFAAAFPVLRRYPHVGGSFWFRKC